MAYLGALGAAAYASGPRRRARGVLAALFALLLFRTHAYLAVLGLGLVIGLRGRALWTGPVLALATLFALTATALVHAAFFGAGRYSMVVFPLVTSLAFAWRSRETLDEAPHESTGESASDRPSPSGSRCFDIGLPGRDTVPRLRRTAARYEETAECP